MVNKDQLLFNECLKQFKKEAIYTDYPINLFLVLKGCIDMVLIDTAFLKFPPYSSPYYNYLLENHLETLKKQRKLHYGSCLAITAKQSIFASEGVYNLSKLAYKYGGETIFFDDYKSAIGVIRPNFTEWGTVYNATTAQEEEERNKHINLLLGVPVLPPLKKQFKKYKKYSMEVVLIYTNMDDDQTIPIQLKAFQLPNKNPINMDSKIKTWKDVLKNITFSTQQKKWTLKNMDIYIIRWLIIDNDSVVIDSHKKLLKSIEVN
jgi:SpoU rRNA methylase family enzyme